MQVAKVVSGICLAGAIGVCAPLRGVDPRARKPGEDAAVLGAACRAARPHLIGPEAPALGVAIEPLTRPGDLTDLEDAYPRLLRELAKVVGSERDAKACLQRLVDRQGKAEPLPEIDCGRETARLGQAGLGHYEDSACSALNDYRTKTLRCWGVMYLSIPGYCPKKRFAVVLMARLDMSGIMESETEEFCPSCFPSWGAVPLPGVLPAKAAILVLENGAWIVKKVVEPCDWPPDDRRLDW